MNLTKYEYTLDTSAPVRPQMSSLFHGVLMENIPSEYADYVHYSQLHPYTQHLEINKECTKWVVTCLNDQAREYIIEQGIDNLNEFDLKRQNIHVRIIDRMESTLSEQELTHQFYNEQASNLVRIRFVTPTAFKQAGRYLFLPDIRCIYQSLMNKYDASAESNVMMDEEVLDQLTEDTFMTGYRLQSVSFQLEGVRIPAFIGEVRWKIKGPQTMVNYANMLLKFGTFSGVGIKTSLGMGAVEIG